MKAENKLVKEASKSITNSNDKFVLFHVAFDVFKNLSHKWMVIIIFLIVWEVLPTIGVLDSTFIVPPSTILLTMWGLTLSGLLPLDTLFTLSRVSIAISLALIMSIPLGFLLGGFFKNFEKTLNPLINIFSNVNPLTLFHVFIILLGIGELSMISVVAWATQWPMLLNTVKGVKEVDPDFIKVARTAGLGRFQTFWRVQIPASLPTVFAGIRLGVIFAFLMLMGVEMMGTTMGTGLGFMIMQAQMETMIPRMWAGIVTMALLGITINYLLLRLENYLTSWKGEDRMIYQ